MADLATLDALAGRLGLDLTDLDLSKANPALANASGIVRALSGPPRQDLTFVSQETVILKGGTQVLTLPQRPAVVDVSNPLTVVELGDFGDVDFIAVEGRDYERLGNELRRGNPWWWTSRYMGWPFNRPLGTWAPRVQVIYSHGYTSIPPEIQSIVLDVAQMQYDNPGLLRSLSIGDYSETYASERLGALTVEGIKAQISGMGYRRGSFSIVPS